MEHGMGVINRDAMTEGSQPNCGSTNTNQIIEMDISNEQGRLYQVISRAAMFLSALVFDPFLMIF